MIMHNVKATYDLSSGHLRYSDPAVKINLFSSFFNDSLVLSLPDPLQLHPEVV